MRARVARAIRAGMPTSMPTENKAEPVGVRAPEGPMKINEMPTMAQKTPATMAVILLATSTSLGGELGMLPAVGPYRPGNVPVKGDQPGDSIGEGFPLTAELLEVLVDLFIEFD